MIPPMSKQAGTLSKVLPADVAVVRPDAGVRENVLIEFVAPRYKHFLANRTRRTRFVHSVLVVLQLPRGSNHQIALGASVTLLVQQQMIVEPGLILKFLHAHVARKLQAGHLGSLLVLPLVTVQIRHGLATVPAYVHVGTVLPVDVHQEVHLHFERLAARIANELGSDVAVRSHLVLLQRHLALVL